MTGAAARTRCVRAGAAQISYLEAGAGPPLALLHGIGSAAASFWNQLEELSAQFRVVALGCPGLWCLDRAEGPAPRRERLCGGAR